MNPSEEKHWHALYVRSRAEKKVCSRLEETGVEVFLPLVTNVKQWSDRRKKVEEPLFKSYIFVRSCEKERYKILQVEGIMHFVMFEQKPAVVPENQILAIKNYISDYEKNRQLLETADLHEGQMVRVISGPMIGLEGRIASAKDNRQLVVYIEAVGQYLTVFISRATIEPIL